MKSTAERLSLNTIDDLLFSNVYADIVNTKVANADLYDDAKGVVKYVTDAVGNLIDSLGNIIPVKDIGEFLTGIQNNFSSSSSSLDKVKEVAEQTKNPTEAAGAAIQQFAWLGPVTETLFDVNIPNVIQASTDLLTKSGGEISDADIDQAISTASGDKISNAGTVYSLAQVERLIKINQSERGYILKSALLYKQAGLLNVSGKVVKHFVGKSAWHMLKSAIWSLIKNILKYILIGLGVYKGVKAISDPSVRGTLANIFNVTPQKVVTPSQTAFEAASTGSREPGVNPISFPGTPNENGIRQLLVNMAKEVYPDLKNWEDVVVSSDGYKLLVKNFMQYNAKLNGNEGDTILVPNEFRNKKDIIDTIIDECVVKIDEIEKSKK